MPDKNPQMTISDEQRSLLRHALGVHRKSDVPGEYRNHYCVYPESKTHAEWLDLVDKGYAEKQKPMPKVFKDMDIFTATPKGFMASTEGL